MEERKKFLAARKENFTEFKPANPQRTLKGSAYENKADFDVKKITPNRIVIE